MRKTGYAVDRVQSVADVHKALSDPTRVRIVHLLVHRGELCVCDVEKILGASQSRASRHLNHLKTAGVVSDQRRGPWVYYRITAKLPTPIRAAVRELKRALEEDPEALADLERAAAAERGIGCRPIEGAPR